MLTKVESYCKLSRLVQESSEYKYGGIAQLARARGSYPRCRWFKSSSRYLCKKRNLQKQISFFLYSNIEKYGHEKIRSAIIKIIFWAKQTKVCDAKL